MGYQVLARKWRPGKFSELVGQEHVVKAIGNALDNNRLHHAYLFTGTRGVGKTTIARIFARSLNCETGVSSNPCGRCASCLDIEQGKYVDLIEIDAASRTKVEDTREILDNVQYRPTRGDYKVYLIDEVHMLSKHSFNALLKTLEEPPPHIKFLLATTDPQKLPITILSRCLQFNLKALTREQIAGQLGTILTAEKLDFEKQAIELLARSAQGSMRDALSLTDQAIAQGNGAVMSDIVSEMLGLIDSNQISRLVSAILEKNKAGVLSLTAELALMGADFKAALAELMSIFHQIALTQFVPEVCKLETMQARQIYAWARALPPESVQLYYQIALQGRKDIEWAQDLRMGFEMALMRMMAFTPESVETNVSTFQKEAESSVISESVTQAAKLTPGDAQQESAHDGDEAFQKKTEFIEQSSGREETAIEDSGSPVNAEHSQQSLQEEMVSLIDVADSLRPATHAQSQGTESAVSPHPDSRQNNPAEFVGDNNELPVTGEQVVERGNHAADAIKATEIAQITEAETPDTAVETQNDVFEQPPEQPAQDSLNNVPEAAISVDSPQNEGGSLENQTFESLSTEDSQTDSLNTEIQSGKSQSDNTYFSQQNADESFVQSDPNNNPDADYFDATARYYANEGQYGLSDGPSESTMTGSMSAGAFDNGAMLSDAPPDMPISGSDYPYSEQFANSDYTSNSVQSDVVMPDQGNYSDMAPKETGSKANTASLLSLMSALNHATSNPDDDNTVETEQERSESQLSSESKLTSESKVPSESNSELQSDSASKQSDTSSNHLGSLSHHNVYQEDIYHGDTEFGSIEQTEKEHSEKDQTVKGQIQAEQQPQAEQSETKQRETEYSVPHNQPDNVEGHPNDGFQAIQNHNLSTENSEPAPLSDRADENPIPEVIADLLLPEVPNGDKTNFSNSHSAEQPDPYFSAESFLSQQQEAEPPGHDESPFPGVGADDTLRHPAQETGQSINETLGAGTSDVTVDLDIPLRINGKKVTKASQVDTWSQLIERANLGGLNKQLALNSNYFNKGDNVELVVSGSQKHLLSNSSIGAIEDSLSDAIQQPIKINARIGDVANTPAAVQKAIDQMRLQHAIKTIHEDSTVSDICHAFSGVVLKETIKPR